MVTDPSISVEAPVGRLKYSDKFQCQSVEIMDSTRSFDALDTYILILRNIFVQRYKTGIFSNAVITKQSLCQHRVHLKQFCSKGITYMYALLHCTHLLEDPHFPIVNSLNDKYQLLNRAKEH